MTSTNGYQNYGWPSREMILAAGPAGSALEDAGYLEIVRAMDLILAPGQVTEPRALGVSTLAYRQPYTIKRMSLKEMRARQTPEQKRVAAYHEAGHAVMKFMFGTHRDIVHIDMRGTLALEAVVRTQGVHRFPIIGDLPRDMKPMYIGVGKRLMMFYLAGFAAENRICPSECGDWLDDELDMNGIGWDESDPDDPHDIAKAVRIAKGVRGDNGNAWRLLLQMAAWTDEALAHPKLWAVVAALAEQLLTVKTRMCGNRVCDIMHNAWNEEAAVPYLKMGPTWRRRFQEEVQRPAPH